MYYCKCSRWAKNYPKIEAAQLFANLHGQAYTGDPFDYCPWCASQLQVGRECEACFAKPWEECKPDCPSREEDEARAR